ncbi:MAG TPA: phage holin family protein [Armatimonadota bacterium]
MGFITRLFINAIALWLTVLLGQKLGLHMGVSGTDGQKAVAVIVMVIALSVVNSVIKPIVKLITAPLNCLTLGLLSFVINAAMFLLAGAIVNTLGYGFRVGGFVGGLFCSVVMGVISSIAASLVDDDRKTRD